MKFIKSKKTLAPSQLKQTSQFSIKTIRISLLTFTLLVLLSGPASFLSVLEFKNNFLKEKENLTHSIQSKLTDTPINNVSSDLYKQFLIPFIAAYINVPTDQTEFENRLNLLNNQYFSFEFEDGKSSNTERKLLSSNFYNFTSSDGKNIATYRILYEVNFPIEKENLTTKKEKDKSIKSPEKNIEYESIKKETLLNIPFEQNEDDTFTINTYPYFSTIPTLTKSNISKTTFDTSSFQQINHKEEDIVKKFTLSFLEKYVSSTLEDMSYLMKTPEILGEDYKIGNSDIQVGTKSNKLVCFITLELIDNKTNIGHKESMTLLLKKRENTYFIEQLNHYLGGI